MHHWYLKSSESISISKWTISNLLPDDIYHESPPKLLYSNVLGGAGIYAALGARIFRGTDDCKSVGVIIHEGCDFPVEAKVELESWQLSSAFIKTPQLTTRGKNVYSEGGVRGKVKLHDLIEATPKLT